MKEQQKQSNAVPETVETRLVETQATLYLQVKSGLKSGACYPRTVCGPYGCRSQTVCGGGGYYGGGCTPRTVCGPNGCRTVTVC